MHLSHSESNPLSISQQQTKNEQRKALKLSDIWQFLRFCIVGSINAIIDFAVLDLLLWVFPTSNEEKIMLYNTVAVLLASTNSFMCNKYWTFQQRQAITSQEIGRFVVLASATTIMNDALMYFLSIVFPHVMSSAFIGANLLKLGAIIGTMSISFFGMRLWVFFHKGIENSPQNSKNLPITSLVATGIDASELPTVHVKVPSIMKTLIIVPTYNEKENLPLLLHEIFAFAPNTDVLIVDDNSPDGTGQIADEMSRKNSHIHVLHRPGKLGLGTAYIAGFKYAISRGYDAAFEMDADFSHDPRYLPNFLKEIMRADLVIGSRYIPGGSTPNWSATRRLISGSGNLFARFMLSIPVHDCTGGYRCYRTHVLQSLDLDSIQSRGYAFQVELTYKVLQKGFKIAETPITFMDRRLGTSKMSKKIVVEAFTYVLQARFTNRESNNSSTSKRNPNVRVRVAQNAAKSFELPSTPFPTYTGAASSVQGSQLPFVPFTPQPNYDSFSESLPPAWAQNVKESYEKSYIIQVETGKDTGRVFPLSKTALSIGRVNESDIILNDPAISRLHASILNDYDGGYILIDENSANGTILNGKTVEKYQRHTLRDGDKIQLGATQLVFAKYQSTTSSVYRY